MASPQRAVPRERTWSFNSVSGQIRPQPVYNYVNNNKIADKIGRLSTKSGGWLGKQSTLPVPRQTPPASAHPTSYTCARDFHPLPPYGPAPNVKMVWASILCLHRPFPHILVAFFNHDIPPSFANQPSPCLPSPATPLPHTPANCAFIQQGSSPPSYMRGAAMNDDDDARYKVQLYHPHSLLPSHFLLLCWK